MGRSAGDPELMTTIFTVGGFYNEAGLREFGSWSIRVIDDVG
jgi:hypothetical protein